jgi:hypothetical protein
MPSFTRSAAGHADPSSETRSEQCGCKLRPMHSLYTAVLQYNTTMPRLLIQLKSGHRFKLSYDFDSDVSLKIFTPPSTPNGSERYALVPSLSAS